MSIKLQANEYGIFESFDIRKALIDNLRKYSDISAVKACNSLNIDYQKFYKHYLNNPHPNGVTMSRILNVTQFKNFLKLYGLDLKYTLYLNNSFDPNEANEVIRTGIKRLRITSDSSEGLHNEVQGSDKETS